LKIKIETFLRKNIKYSLIDILKYSQKNYLPGIVIICFEGISGRFGGASRKIIGSGVGNFLGI
jgi:hypothetical protein